MSAKKTPMRMCTGCREMKPKQQLIRIVKTPDGEIETDVADEVYAAIERELLSE